MSVTTDALRGQQDETTAAITSPGSRWPSRARCPPPSGGPGLPGHAGGGLPGRGGPAGGPGSVLPAPGGRPLGGPGGGRPDPLRLSPLALRLRGDAASTFPPATASRRGPGSRPTRARRRGGSSGPSTGRRRPSRCRGIPGAEERELICEAHFRGTRAVDPWVSISNGVDFQHLRTLHGIPAVEPDAVRVGPHAIEYRIESPHFVQHGRITGVNTFAQYLAMGGEEAFMLFSGAPIAHGQTRGFYAYGVRDDGTGRDGVAARLDDPARLRAAAARGGRPGAGHDPVPPAPAGGLRPAPRALLQVRARVPAGGPAGGLTRAEEPVGRAGGGLPRAALRGGAAPVRHPGARRGHHAPARGRARLQPDDALSLLPQQGRDPGRGAHRRLRSLRGGARGGGRAGARRSARRGPGGRPGLRPLRPRRPRRLPAHVRRGPARPGALSGARARQHAGAAHHERGARGAGEGGRLPRRPGAARPGLLVRDARAGHAAPGRQAARRSRLRDRPGAS